MTAPARKMAMWLDGIGWVTPFSIAESPEDGKDPDGAAVPVVPGCQRMCVDAIWYYVTTPANLGTMLQAASVGTVPAQQAAPSQPQSPPVSLNPMAMMNQMLQSSMMMQMMQSMGVNLSTAEPKAPLDLTQLKEPAAILGEKIKEAVLGGIQIWRAMKGTP